MLITQFALSHRTTTFVFAFLILVAGMVSYLAMPREAAPDIKIPTIMVVVPYPGVSPEDIESLVTNQLEGELEDLRDLDTITSTSSEGMSLVSVSFLPNTDLTDASQRVRDRVNRCLPKLPADIQEPQVRELTSSDWPILKINISGTAGLLKLKRIGEDLEESIESIEGVIEVDLAGGLERELRVEVNPHQLAAYGLGLTDVVNALRGENINIPGGAVEEGTIRYTLRIPQEFTDPDELGRVVVSTKFDHPVRVREVAQVVDSFKERTTMSRFKGVEGISLTVKKEAGANIIAIVDEIKKLVEEKSVAFPPGTEVNYLNDVSKYIRQSVRELENNILTALVLVMAVLFLFIGGRNALFVALAIPFSMLLSFIVLDALGVTLNMVVLFGLILALGMLVDNAIVIIENIYRHSGMGKPLMAAALEGTQEVGWPVITSTLTTLAVFFPLLAWPGIMGDFISYLPRTLILTLSASLFVALVISPVLAATFMKPAPPGGEGPEPGRTRFSLRALFVNGYLAFLRWSLRHRAVVVVATVALFVGSLVALGAFRPMVEFFPATTPERGRITVRAAEGTALHLTNRISLQAEAVLATLPNVASYLADVGVGGGRMAVSGAEGTPYLASISFDFQERAKWLEYPLNTLEELRTRLAPIAGATLRIEKEKGGPPTGAPVNIEISGDDFGQLSAVAEEVKGIVRDVPGLTDLRDDFEQGRPELTLFFNRVLSNQLVLQNLQIVAGTVRTAFYGSKATAYRMGEDEFDVTVRLQDRFRDLREKVADLVIAGKEGRQIPLSAVAEVTGRVGATSIRHVDRKRVVTVSADAEGRPGAEVLRECRKRLTDFNRRGAQLSYTGENKEMAKAQTFLSKALLIGIFLIALVLLTEFNSLGQVALILVSVLLSLVGVFWGIIINRMPFSVLMTGIGIISLAGVVVNNAIVLIDFANKLRAEGRPLTEAIVEAGRVRLRPVLLTAGTTILGLLPMAQGFDFDLRTFHLETNTSSMEFWGPMAIAVIYGLSFATALTLVVVPVLYHLLDSGRERSARFLAGHRRLRQAAMLAGLGAVGLFAWLLIAGISGQ